MDFNDFVDRLGNIPKSETNTTYGPDGQLSVVGVLDSGKSTKYLVHCSVCSKDTELYGEGYFECYRGNLRKGALVCGCSPNYLPSEEQMRVRVSRKIVDKNIHFVDWFGKYQGIKTKCIMLCCKHGLWNTTVASGFLHRGNGCPTCKLDKYQDTFKKPEDILIGKINDWCNNHNYIFLGFSSEYSGIKNTGAIFSCPEHGVWTSKNLLQIFRRGGGKCPTCPKNTVKPKPLNSYMDRILEAVKQKDLGFVGVFGDYIGTLSKLSLTCRIHGTWNTSTISNFLKGSSCPSCNGHNQNVAYINIVYDNDLPIALKFGITSNLYARLCSQNYRSSVSVVNLKSYYFHDSEVCKKVERIVKSSITCGIINKRQLSDGYTETTYLHNLDKIIQIYEDHGGIQIEDS